MNARDPSGPPVPLTSTPQAPAVGPQATRAQVEHHLRDALPPLLAQASRALLDTLATEFLATAWRGAQDAPPEWAASAPLPYRLLRFLRFDIEQQLSRIRTLRSLQADYSQRYRRAVTQDERERHLLEFARALGASPRQLRGDRRALRRWLGDDTLTARNQRRQATSDRRLAFVLERVGQLSARLLEQLGTALGHGWLWQRLRLEELTLPLLAHDGDPRVRVAAFRALALALRVLPAGDAQRVVTQGAVRSIYGAALDHRQSIWMQIEALGLLHDLDPAALVTVLRTRLLRPGTGDDLFLRRRAVLLLGRSLERQPELAELLPSLRNDPAPYVRQGLAQALSTMPPGAAVPLWRQLARTDDSAPVRAAALLQVPSMLTPATLSPLADGLAEALTDEREPFVIRVALRVVWQSFEQLLDEAQDELAGRWLARLGPVCAHLHTASGEPAVRRWAAQTRERLWVAAHPQRHRTFKELEQWLAATPRGLPRRVPSALAQLDEAELGRLLAVATQQDHGCELRRDWRGLRLIRGQVLRFRFWRWWYEAWHPASDKRPAIRHTVGRVYRGHLCAPSGILAEMAETKVPGEPLYMETEQDWRPWLPLVDELISALDQWAPRLCRYTSEGVTEVVAPRGWGRRLWARADLSLRFAHYARLRNWHEGSQLAPAVYLTALAQLGFGIRFSPYPAAPDLPTAGDPWVERFFPPAAAPATAPPSAAPDASLTIPMGQGLALLPALDWASWWERLRDYFFSVYQNSLFDLGVFLSVLGALFVGKHLYSNYRTRIARQRLALAIGGWGTRGKSGTERLKAALLNGLGLAVFSKTTGCEAMFLYADPYGTLREIYLYRPYDKATIWEQTDVLRMAMDLHSEVFLWECMGLGPSYVNVLQRQWMHDDVSTITNTYPDHEDVQGPAGYNIAEVMTEFIPQRALLLTSEEQMLPILRDAATRLGTRTAHVGWLEAGLLTPDILSRFPYEEHPYNIALVLRLAEEMGVEADVALKEMADRVVMDLGVLKRYPRSLINGRWLEFVNGMSANEHFGCLNNWKRMEFDRQDREHHPGVWISTLVNNRADRISRSQVFAGILVNDLSADRHFLIGSNLDGLQDYIRHAWHAWAADITLWPAAGNAGTDEALAILEQQARRQRLPTREALLRERLQALLTELGVAVGEPPPTFWRDPQGLNDWLAGQGLAAQHRDPLAAHLLEEGQQYEEYQQLVGRVATAQLSQHRALNEEFHALLWRWFAHRLVVVRDAHASGEQIIARIAQETPPGLHHRVMGIQNIKGPGLDFVYRWQSWEQCHRLCHSLHQDDPERLRAALRELSQVQAFGQLDEHELLNTITAVRQHDVAQSEYVQAELTLIESRVKAALRALHAQLSAAMQQGHEPLLNQLLGSIEAFFDAGDAVKRRRKANRIYRDLMDERIAAPRAALELRELVRRQTGGWLKRQLRSWLGLAPPARQ